MKDKSVQDIELEDFSDVSGSEKGAPILNDNLSLVGHVKAQADIVLGSAEITIAELFALKEGSVVPMNEDVDKPALLVLDGKTVAKGNLVVIGDKFGFEITELT